MSEAKHTREGRQGSRIEVSQSEDGNVLISILRADGGYRWIKMDPDAALDFSGKLRKKSIEIRNRTRSA